MELTGFIEQSVDDMLAAPQPAALNEARFKVASELSRTEETYVDALETMLIHFKLPLVAKQIISVEEAQHLFTDQLNILVNCHRALVAELRGRLRLWSQYYVIGDILARHFGSVANDLATAYMAYMRAFPTAVLTLGKLTRNNARFVAYHESIVANSASCRSLPLASFLLTPIQRLPRYLLLVRELIKLTPQDHEDYFYLHKAQDKLGGMLDMLNDNIEENTRLVQEQLKKKTVRRTTPSRKARRPLSSLLSRLQVHGRSSPRVPESDSHRRRSNSLGHEMEMDIQQLSADNIDIASPPSSRRMSRQEHSVAVMPSPLISSRSVEHLAPDRYSSLSFGP